MKELLPDVFTWSWLSPRHGYNFNGYLVRLPLGNVCIDPVEMTDDVLDELARQGVTSMLVGFYEAVGWHVSVQWK